MGIEAMLTSLASGAAAGLTVDVVLYPVDTVKTRLQSKDGFRKAGGFYGIYRGLGSAALGSVPSASTFFLAYDTSKYLLHDVFSSDLYVHMLAGCIGETCATMVRIPFEVVKQTAQGNPGFTSRSALLHVISRNGVTGLFRGYFSMVMRDIPYSVIQMPLWEFLKSNVRQYTGGTDVTGLQSGICGSMSGAIAGALTNPLDLAKTRIILSQKSSGGVSTGNPLYVIQQIAKEEGVSKLFSGVTPRVFWLSCGGFVFFGAYEFTRNIISNHFL